jgi:hypothetical protein
MLSNAKSMTRREALAALSLPALAVGLGGCASAAPVTLANVPAAPVPRVRVRDRWRYAGTNLYNQLPIGELATEVVESGPLLKIKNRYTDERPTQDDLYTNAWNVVQETHYDVTERFSDPVPLLPSRLEAGASERVRTTYRALISERQLFWSLYLDARNWEKIRVPAGEFTCLRIDRRMWFSHYDVFRYSSERFETLWYAPDVNCWVQREWTGYYVVPGGRRGARFREDWVRWQLLDHIPAPVAT